MAGILTHVYLENIEIEIKQELNEMSLSRENLSSGVCDQERHKLVRGLKFRT